MNLDNFDLEALQRDLDEFARQQQQRGWLRRNWLWFVPTLLVVLILVGGAALYWALFCRIYSLDIYQTAMQQIQADKAVVENLGEPVTKVRWPPPSARLEDAERDIRWPIQGPQGRAKAHVNSRKMQGKWEIIQLEVELADGKRLVVADDGPSEADAPAFAPAGAEPSPQEPKSNEPAPSINLDIPTGDGPGT